jgi:hypothetical protein
MENNDGVERDEPVKSKKNADYSASAVMLGDHEPVKIALSLYKGTEVKLEECKKRLEATPEYKELSRIAVQLAEVKVEVREVIDDCGSYQDLENGIYAVKQRRESKTYLAEPFAKNYEKFAPVVIEQAINVKALEGLIKGKLITEDELKDNGVIKVSESFVYIIK